MNNYIIPLIGDIKLDDITPRLIDKFYRSLPKVKSKVTPQKKPKSEYLTPTNIQRIHQLLRSAFNQAVKWELMARNPCLNATPPKAEKEERHIWTAETLMYALEVCDNDILSLAINLSFACSLRMGEMLGLTWDCVDISEAAIEENTASLYINKELQRAKKKAMEELNGKDVIMQFPEMLKVNETVLVLKTPKTKTSVRKVFIPKTVALMLAKRKEQIEEMMALYGDEYMDYNLVFCHPTGRPMEGSVIRNALNKLIKDNNLPPVVFHSFRHASITYKLKWNGGDMKSVQGDSGHAQMDMIADVYSHIIDEDRRYNAQKFEEQFYETKGLRVDEGTGVPQPKFEYIEEKHKTAAYGEKIEKPDGKEMKHAGAESKGVQVGNPNAQKYPKVQILKREEPEVKSFKVNEMKPGSLKYGEPQAGEMNSGESQAAGSKSSEADLQADITGIEALTKLLTNPDTAALLKALAKNL